MPPKATVAPKWTEITWGNLGKVDPGELNAGMTLCSVCGEFVSSRSFVLPSEQKSSASASASHARNIAEKCRSCRLEEKLTLLEQKKPVQEEKKAVVVASGTWTVSAETATLYQGSNIVDCTQCTPGWSVNPDNLKGLCAECKLRCVYISIGLESTRSKWPLENDGAVSKKKLLDFITDNSEKKTPTASLFLPGGIAQSGTEHEGFLEMIRARIKAIGNDPAKAAEKKTLESQLKRLEGVHHGLSRQLGEMTFLSSNAIKNYNIPSWVVENFIAMELCCGYAVVKLTAQVSHCAFHYYHNDNGIMIGDNNVFPAGKGHAIRGRKPIITGDLSGTPQLQAFIESFKGVEVPGIDSLSNFIRGFLAARFPGKVPPELVEKILKLKSDTDRLKSIKEFKADNQSKTSSSSTPKPTTFSGVVKAWKAEVKAGANIPQPNLKGIEIPKNIQDAISQRRLKWDKEKGPVLEKKQKSQNQNNRRGRNPNFGYSQGPRQPLQTSASFGRGPPQRFMDQGVFEARMRAFGTASGPRIITGLRGFKEFGNTQGLDINALAFADPPLFKNGERTDAKYDPGAYQNQKGIRKGF